MHILCTPLYPIQRKRTMERYNKPMNHGNEKTTTKTEKEKEKQTMGMLI